MNGQIGFNFHDFSDKKNLSHKNHVDNMIKVKKKHYRLFSSSAENFRIKSKNNPPGQKQMHLDDIMNIKKLLLKDKIKKFDKNNKEKRKEKNRDNNFNNHLFNVSNPLIKKNNKFRNELPKINNQNDVNGLQKKFILVNKAKPTLLKQFNKIDNNKFNNKDIHANNFNNNIVQNNHIKVNMNDLGNLKNKNLQLKPNNQKKQRAQSSLIIKSPKFIMISKTCANGLANIGATCYMNATLQCLAHIEKLTYFFLNSDTKTKLIVNPNKYPLSSAYLTVIENLWQNKIANKYYSPKEFKEIISEMNPLFKGIQANDSKDLVIFLLETMHNELNRVDNNISMIDNSDENDDQRNYEIMFKNFTSFFKKKYNSPISHLFYGMFNSIMNCQFCHVITYNVQCFNIVIFPLQKVKEFKMKLTNEVNIFECFEYYQRPEYIGGRTYYCNYCRQMVDTVNTSIFLYCPKIIVINLNRGHGLEFDIKLNFDEYIDISNYVYYKDNSPTYYELIGIVTHFGPSSMSGHFIAFCKSFGNQQWYKYNDAIVDPCTFEEAKNTGVPYILFYSYIKR